MGFINILPEKVIATKDSVYALAKAIGGRWDQPEFSLRAAQGRMRQHPSESQQRESPS